MASKYYPKKLIVEGDQDKRVIPQLIEANGIPWKEIGIKVPYIESYGSNIAVRSRVVTVQMF